ncbi:TVP38/TMEM64 family protein [Peribacillus simplex]
MKIKYAIIAIWLLSFFALAYFDLLPTDINTIKHFFSENQKYALVIFIGLWILRLLFLIPGTPLMILGGVYFGPIEEAILSTIGLVMSVTLIYFSNKVSGKKTKNFMENRYKDLSFLIKTNNYKLLALGMICPIVPGDVLCFLSAANGIKYSTYILTIVLANAPLRLLYSYIGVSFTKSTGGLILTFVSIALMFIVSMKMWNTLKKTNTGLPLK